MEHEVSPFQEHRGFDDTNDPALVMCRWPNSRSQEYWQSSLLMKRGGCLKAPQGLSPVLDTLLQKCDLIGKKDKAICDNGSMAKFVSFGGKLWMRIPISAARILVNLDSQRLEASF